MKLLIFLSIVIAAAYYYSANQVEMIVVKDWPSLLKKAEVQGAKVEEVRSQVHTFATNYCQNSTYQESIGRSTGACLRSYANLSEMCERRIFKSVNKRYTSKSDVEAVGQRFATCVSAL